MGVRFPSLNYVPRRGSTGSRSNSMFNLEKKELLNFFPMQLHQFMFPPATYEGSDGSTLSPTLVMVRLSAYGRPGGCEVVPHCGLGCPSLMTDDVEHLFICFLIICTSTLEDVTSSRFGCFSRSSSLSLSSRSAFWLATLSAPESPASHGQSSAVFYVAGILPTSPSISEADLWCSDSCG